jgi:hypothetical protein
MPTVSSIIITVTLRNGTAVEITNLTHYVVKSHYSMRDGKTVCVIRQQH